MARSMRERGRGGRGCLQTPQSAVVQSGPSTRSSVPHAAPPNLTTPPAIPPTPCRRPTWTHLPLFAILGLHTHPPTHLPTVQVSNLDRMTQQSLLERLGLRHLFQATVSAEGEWQGCLVEC